MPDEPRAFTILIVEHNRFFRDALHEALQTRFIFPLLPRSASIQSALAKIDAMRPDMIFVDVNLPDGNGLELTRRLRAAGNDAVISILTHHDLPEYRQEATRSGADHLFVKGSTDIGEIYAAVESTLAARFRTRIVSEQAPYGDQVSALLSDTRLSVHARPNGTSTWA